MERLYYPHRHDATAATAARSAATYGKLNLTAEERDALDAVIAAAPNATAVTQTQICAAHEAIFRHRHKLPRTSRGADG